MKITEKHLRPNREMQILVLDFEERTRQVRSHTIYIRKGDIRLDTRQKSYWHRCMFCG